MSPYRVSIVGRWFPMFWFKGVGWTFGSRIFILKPYWEQASPLVREMLMTHEKIHIEQQSISFKRWLWWVVRYIFVPSFRYGVELEAYLAEMRFLALRSSDHLADAINQAATNLSGGLYFHMVSFADAKKDLLKGLG